tara:strand:- start:144 stop:386 length:243 start_codon:yes stop_codon:yes gene_type:complete
MIKKLNKISLKKNDQTYLQEMLKKYPGINSGRKNYLSQYRRILKNILLTKVYNLSSKNIILNNRKNIIFKENNKFLSIKF